MESTDSNATQKSNDPYEEDQGDANEAGDDDLWPEWPDGGMVCPVTGCGTKFYVNLTTYWGHWKRKHLEQLRQLYCPKCPHKSLNKHYFATHLTEKHKIKMSDLDQIIASAHTELIPNKEFIPPGTQRCPKRKSLNSESQMAPKRQRMKPPSQDSQCKHDEDNSSMTAAETDVKASICNVAKEVSSDNEIERLPITLSKTGQREGSDKNGSHANETSRNDNIPHSHHSKKATVFPPTEAQNISFSDAESEKWSSDSNFIIEMEKEKPEVVQLPYKGWHEGGMRCHVPACGSKHFDTLNSYQAHWKQIHSDTIKEFKCPLCSFKQSEKLQLQRHLRLKHKVDKTALQAMLSIVKAEVIPNQQFIDPGTVEFPKGKVHDLSGSEGKTKRPRLSSAQVLEIKQGSGGDKKSTKQTDFNDQAVAGNLGSDLAIQSDNKKHVDDFGFEDKRILQVGLKVDTAAAISKEDNVSNDIVKQVVAVLEREETEINELVTMVTESSVEIKRKDPDVDKATVESDKAIDTQVLECVTKITESVVEMKRKVDIESEKTVDTQVSESFTNVTESALQIKRKFAVVDKGTIEMEKAIDAQVLECVPKVTECAVQIADVDNGTIEMDKAIDTQVLECVPKVTECAVQIADVDKDTIEMEKAIDTQVLECVPKVTESGVQIADVDKGSVERDKDTQVSVCVGTSDIQRNVDSKKVSEAARKIETVTDSASNFHNIPSDRIRKEADKSITEIPESSCIRKRQREDEDKINPPVETETVNDKERHGIYISYDTVIRKGDDESEYNDKDQSECDIKDQSEYNDKDQSEYDIKDQSEYNDKDQSEYDIKDQSEYNDKDQRECDIKNQSECDIKDQSEYNDKDQSECDIKDQSDHNESDQDLTVTDDSELDEAKEAEDLDTVVRPIFLDGQMLCPGSGCLDLDQVYDSLKAFYKHWQDEHQSSVQRFECPSCSFKDVRKLEIRRHLKTEHNKRHRGVLEELMSLVKLESTPKTAEDSKSETSSKRKSTSQLKTKIKKQKIPLESDADETKDGKDTKDESPKDKDAIRAEIQCVGESNEKLSPKKEKVVWFFGMSCPVKNCCTRKFVSPREFHNHWENVHNPYIKKFECPICQYQNTQREVVGNHLRLSHNAVKTNDVRDLSQIKMVDVGNPMYKDPGMFYFGNVSSMPIENQDVKAMSTMSPVQVTTSDTSEALVESTKKSSSKNEQCGLETLSSKSGAREKEPVKVVFVSNMLCPVDNCGFHIFTRLSAFKNHWRRRHLPLRDQFKCRICNFRSYAKQNVSLHIKNVHGMMYPAVVQNIYNVLDINVLFHDPSPFYFEESLFELTNVADSASCSKSASGLQKKEDKAGTDGIHELKKAEDTGTQANEENEKISKDSIPVHWVLGMSCPVMNCGASYFMTFLSFQSHWENIHNINILKFKCPLCTFTNITKANIIAHLSVQHKMSDGMIKAKTNQIQNVKVKNNRYIDPGFYSFSVMEQFQTDQTNTSPSEKKEMDLGGDLKGKIEKTRKVTWMEGMCCPVKACGSETYLTLDSFSNHWIKTHHLEHIMFQCSLCSFKTIQKSDILNHLKSHHWILSEKDVTTALTKVNVVKELNPAFKDTEGYYFKTSGVPEEEGECSLSHYEDKPSEQTSNEMDLGSDLKGKIEKTRKVNWMEGMCCPVKACGSETYLTLDSFSNHWIKTHHLEINMFQCSLCTFKTDQKSDILNHLKSHHCILADKDEMTALTKVNVVKELNPAFKNTEGYYLQIPGTEEEAECSLSKSENKSSEQASNEMDLGGDLKGKIEKTRKVTWMEGMCCPVKACGSETYLTLDSFSNHWIKTHHLELNMFQCSLCTFKTDQKSDILNHLKSHHCILAEKDEKTALTKVNVVKVLNPAFKDTESYYFEIPGTEEEAECSLSKSESKSSEQASNEMDLGGDLKGKIEKTRKVSWMEGMCCPVKACGSETYLTLESFSNHWIKTHHLELNMFQCSLCSFKTIQKSDILNHLKSHHWILVEKDVTTALTKVNVVKVLNPAFKDTEGYYFESPGTEEEAECSLSKSKNRPSEQASNEMDLGGDLKGKIEKTRKVTWMEGMSCPVKACGSETYLTLDSFSNHWIKTHHLELNMFQCSRCVFRAIQKSEIENHLKSHHWILSEKDVTTALTKVNVVKVLNPAFKDTEGYYFETSGTEEEAECSLSKSENKSSEQASNVTIGTCEASVKSMKNSPSENQEVSLKSVTSNEEPIKVVFVSNMRCPVDKCCTRGFRKLSNFKNHWKARHLPFQEHYICKICNSRKTAENCKYWHLKNIYWHIENVHGIKHPTIEQNIIIEHNTNFHFMDPGPLYFEKVARSTDGSKSASSIQKKEEKESKSMSEEGMPKIVVEWKYNMTCPIQKCHFEVYDSWTTYCKHWKMVHEQRYLKTHACPKCSFQSGQRSHLVNHMKQCHNLVRRELERAAEEIKFVDVENPSFIDPGNYTCNWFGKSNENKKSSTTASPEISKSEATLQKKGTEPTEEEERYPKKFMFAPGMPCPVKNCSSVQISSYSAFVHHWNEQHALMLKKFACTMCDFKHIQKSIVFMHVRKEHGMPSYVITKKIKTVKETNVKAEELYVPDLPTDHRRSVVMVKPDDSGQFNTYDTNGGKIKEATDVVEKIKKSDENIGKLNEQKDESRDESKGQMHEDTCTGLRDEKKPLESTQPADVDKENVLTNNTTQMVYKSSDNDTKLRMSASENQEEKEATLQKKGTEPTEEEERYPKKFMFAPGMPCPVKNCSLVQIKSYSAFVHHWNEQHALMLKKFACTICDFRHIQKSIVFMHVRKEHGMPSHVITQKITMVTETNSQYVDADELYFPEFPAEDRKLLIMVKPDDSETGAFEEVLPGSSAEQPTLTVTVQTEVKQLVFPKDIEDTIEKEKLYVKGKDESTKEDVKIVVPSGSSDVPKIVAADEDVISDFEEDSVTVDMSEFICLDEIGDEDAEASEMSPEKQIAKETELPGDQDYEIQDEVSSPTEDDQIEDILKYFVCIDDIGDEKDDIGDENDDIGNEKDNIGDEERS